jgi:hypothetical protein
LNDERVSSTNHQLMRSEVHIAVNFVSPSSGKNCEQWKTEATDCSETLVRVFTKIYGITQQRIVNLRLLIGYIIYILPCEQLHLLHEPEYVAPCVGTLTKENSSLSEFPIGVSVSIVLHIKSGKFLMMTPRATSQVGHDSLSFPCDKSGPSERRK